MILSSKSLLFISYVLVVLITLFMIYFASKGKKPWLVVIPYLATIVVEYIFVEKPITSPSGIIILIFLNILVGITHLVTYFIFRKDK
ncbi:hypothetical protein EDC32_1011108 [Laceyella sacchari]|nr:hypothetical protein EDC32_1011108 [Laceyella sacchari]